MRKQILVLLSSLVAASLICGFAEGESKRFVKEVIWRLGGKRYVSITRIDDSGVPVQHYSFAGPQRNPLFVAGQALSHLRRYERTGDEKDRQIAFNCVNWLVENAVQRGSYAIYEHAFAVPLYGLPPGWRSALSQGFALLAILRAYEMTGEDRYLVLSKRVLNAFSVEIADGGITDKTESRGWWYEEYASERVEPPRVLNGMISALFALQEYYESTGDERAKYLFDQGVLALVDALPGYDKGGYSYYDREGHLSGGEYHKMHISQLDSLYKLTGVEVFRAYSQRWRTYYRLPIALQLILNPEFKRFVVFSGVFLLALLGFEAIIVLPFAWERRHRSHRRDNGT